MQIVMMIDKNNELKECFSWLEEHMPEFRPIVDGVYRWSFKPSAFDNSGKQYLFYFKDDQDARDFTAHFNL